MSALLKRDRFKILAAKEMAQGRPKKGMVRIASFRFYVDAISFWNQKKETDMRNWYLQMLESQQVLDVHEGVCQVTGHLDLS